MVFLELRRDSRLNNRELRIPLVLAQGNPISIRVAKEAGDCSRVTAGQIDLI